MALFMCIYMLRNSQVFPRNCQFKSSKYKDSLKEYLRTILGFHLMFGVNSKRCIKHFCEHFLSSITAEQTSRVFI